MAGPKHRSTLTRRRNRNVKDTASKIANITVKLLSDCVLVPKRLLCEVCIVEPERLPSPPQSTTASKAWPKGLPESLPTPRPRALTMPLEPGSQQNFLEQMQSELFNKLPGELRMMIYEKVLGGSNRHIIRDGKRLCGVECAYTRYQTTSCMLFAHKFEFPTEDTDCFPPYPGYPAGCVALLLTCRKMYVFHV